MGQHDKKKAIRRVIFRIVVGLLILIIFSYLLSINITNIAGYERTIQDVTFSSVLLEIVLQLAKERGLSSIWLTSNGTFGFAPVLAQRAHSDAALGHLAEQPEDAYREELAVVRNATQFLAYVRAGVGALNITFEEVLDDFGWMNGVILDRAGKAHLSRGTLVRFYLAQEIEMRALLRGTMSGVFQLGAWTPQLFRRVTHVMAKVELFEKEVNRYASDAQLRLLDALRAENQTAEGIARAGEYLSAAVAQFNETSKSLRPLGVQSTDWFNASTAEVVCLTVLYREVSATVVREAQSAKWWDLLVVIIGLLLELVSLTEMVIAILPVVAFGLKWRDLSWAQTTSTNMTTAPSH